VAGLQAILNTYSSAAVGGPARTATLALVDSFNAHTTALSALNKAQLIAHMVWESSGLALVRETGCATNCNYCGFGAVSSGKCLTATDKCLSTGLCASTGKAVAAQCTNGAHCYNYQSCDWNNMANVATNGKVFNGRGFLQLSWCANYKGFQTYLASLTPAINADLYNNPELVASTYPMLSAVWFYSIGNGVAVAAAGSEFGKTTKIINSGECIASNYKLAAPWSTPQKRYLLFKTAATQFGVTGYTENGCYN
jgi:predicted chitinase